MKWISVKDKLPELESSILCICLLNDGDDYLGIFRGFHQIASWNYGSFYSRCENITKEVTHWIPIPDLPKD